MSHLYGRGIPWLLEQLEQMHEEEETGPGESALLSCFFESHIMELLLN